MTGRKKEDKGKTNEELYGTARAEEIRLNAIKSRENKNYKRKNL